MVAPIWSRLVEKGKGRETRQEGEEKEKKGQILLTELGRFLQRRNGKGGGTPIEGRVRPMNEADRGR